VETLAAGQISTRGRRLGGDTWGWLMSCCGECGQLNNERDIIFCPVLDGDPISTVWAKLNPSVVLERFSTVTDQRSS